jgi:hypothetical protein
MFAVDKNNFGKWTILLQVLTEEIPEKDPLFQAWLKENVGNEKLYRTLKGEIKDRDIRFDKDKVYANLSEILSFKIVKTPFYKKAWFGYVSAIMLLISIGTTTYFASSKMDVAPEPVVSGQPEKNLFDPGSKKAYLLSSQGEAIDLSESFQLEKEDGTIVSNNTKGIISFENSEQPKKAVEHQTIYVPKSGEYTLWLADGTKVYLNSETRLTFPSYFEGDTRDVELLGEAYFEVQKSEKPFIVHTANLQIEVLGTMFNVNAYQDDSHINTTLVEGSVQIRTQLDPASVMLTPGHQFRLDTFSGEVSVQKVNTEIYTAWVKGEFVFRNQPLGEILAQLARWYDFTVEFEDASIRDMKFTGSAEKKRTLDYLLDQIKTVTDIKYKDEGTKIIFYR